MSFFRQPKIYAVYIKPQSPQGQHRPVLVREGFNIFAFLFGIFWSLYHRLWLVSLGIVAYNVALMYIGRWHLLTDPSVAAIQMGAQVLIGFQANDWRQSKLRHKGYILSDIAMAETPLHAEQRYLERTLVAA